MANVTYPTGMTLRDWSDCICLDVGQLGTVGRIDKDENWKDWASQFLNLPGIGRTIPDPAQFSTWREWADTFCLAVG